MTVAGLAAPAEGVKREMPCPACKRSTINMAVFMTVDHVREFSGWRCTTCGSEHSGC